MANNGVEFNPPRWGTVDVLYGTGFLYYAAVGTALPADVDLGDSTKWQAGGWTYPGATDQGLSITFTPRMTELGIEEQPIPVAEIVETATFMVETALAEETLTNINLAYGAGGAITTVAASAGQPGKQTLRLSSNFAQLTVAVLAKNDLGYPRVFNVPVVMSTGTVKTDFRRAAAKRTYPLSLSSLVDLDQCEIIDIRSPAL